ncbi:MAG: FAD-binding protein [Erythrobacter sp.]|jgi:hypothetical protein|nr:FAD-binding protein [Erythrobacter sp.]
MVRTIEIDGGDWLDEHRTCDRHALSTIKVIAEPGGDLAADLAARGAVLGALMDDLAARGKPVAITGSAWSQSDLFASPAIRVDTALDSAVWEVPASAFAPGVTGDTRRFVMATGGARLEEVMRFLDERGYSFRTAGSHKGQSIGGAIATGTHGSLLGETGLETHVRGLMFVGGTGAVHWIADPAAPVLDEAFVSAFAAPADPALFDDCVIHLGGLGYLAAVLIEGVPRFGLSWRKALEPLGADWWDAIEAADYARAAAPVIGAREPAFYEITFDPNRALEDPVMQTIYWRDDLPADATPPQHDQAPPAPAEARDALDLLIDGINAFSAHMVEAHGSRDEEEDDDDDGIFSFARRLRLLDIAGMIFDDFEKELARQPQSARPESLLALTGDWKHREVMGIRIDTFNAALAVPVTELRRTLEIGRRIAADWRRHFVFTVRFAVKSRASLSFLRFEDCAIVNIDGLTRAGIAGWISHSDEFSHAYTDALETAGVPFSMHWGKDIESDGGKIAADFDAAAQRYRAARAALVPAPLRAVLCPPALARWGLA